VNRERDVLVILETSGEDRQEINEGLLSEGYRIGRSLGGSLRALTIGSAVESVLTLEEYGVSTLYILKGDIFSKYRCEVFSQAMATFLQTALPRLVLFPHRDRGKELAPRVASLLDSAVVTDCVDIRVEAGELSYVKPLYGNQFEQKFSFLPGLVEMASIRPEVLSRKKAPQRCPLQVEEVPLEISPDVARTEPLGIVPPDFRTVDILHAQRILGAGSGAAEPDLLPLVQKLSHLLEGALGTTRPVVDDGHLPKDRMIGQTGKQVRPDLYLALGVSGSPHHVTGVQEARRIVSVNKDPRAPIFHFSDIGFIGDLRKVLPKLIARIEEFKGKGSHEIF
jgi:electron transfer flavoprotein alpha subunit